MHFPFLNLFKPEKCRTLGIVAAIIANFSNRLDIVVGKKLLSVLSPIFLSFLGMMISSILIFSYIEFRHHLKQFIKLPLKQAIAMTGSTLLSAVIAPVLFLQGLKLTTGTNASLFINLSPLFLSIFAVFFLNEQITKKLASGTIITLFGILFLITNGFSGKIMFSSGDLFIILAAISYGFSNIIFKKFIHEDHIDVLVAYRCLTAMIILFFGVILISPQDFQNITHLPNILPEILIYTLIVTLVTYILHYWSMEHVDIQTLSLIMLTSPVIGVAYAAIFLGEKLTPAHVISTLIIVGGITLSKLHLGEAFLKIKLRLRHLH